MFLGKKASKPHEKNLKNSKTTLEIHYTFTYYLKIKNFVAGLCFPVNFVGLRLGFDVPEQVAPLRRYPSRLAGSSTKTTDQVRFWTFCINSHTVPSTGYTPVSLPSFEVTKDSQ